MYDKIYFNFKEELTDRRIDYCYIIMSTICFITYSVLCTLLYRKYKSWIVPVLCRIIMFFVCFAIYYVIAYCMLKRKANLASKDFFHFKKVFNFLISSQPKDIEIILKILKENGISTNEQLLGAISHYQNELLCKSKKGVTTMSVLSLVIAILGLIFQSVIFANTKDIIVFLFSCISLIIFVTLICFAARLIYKAVYYDLSEYALYKRIEKALSEIHLTNALNNQDKKIQYGFISHLV